jgi:hypothetical protein
MTDIDGRLIGMEERQVAYEESTIKVSTKVRGEDQGVGVLLQQEKAQGPWVGRRDAAINCG